MEGYWYSLSLHTPLYSSSTVRKTFTILQFLVYKFIILIFNSHRKICEVRAMFWNQMQNRTDPSYLSSKEIPNPNFFSSLTFITKSRLGLKKCDEVSQRPCLEDGEYGVKEAVRWQRNKSSRSRDLPAIARSYSFGSLTGTSITTARRWTGWARERRTTTRRLLLLACSGNLWSHTHLCV